MLNKVFLKTDFQSKQIRGMEKKKKKKVNRYF